MPLHIQENLTQETAKLKKRGDAIPEEEVAEFIARAQDLCRQSIIKIIEDRAISGSCLLE